MAVYLSYERRVQQWSEEEIEKELVRLAEDSVMACKFSLGLLSLLEAKRDELAHKIASSENENSVKEDKARWRLYGDLQLLIVGFLPQEDQEQWMAMQ